MDLKELFELKEKSFKYFTEEESLKAVRKNGFTVQYVKNQTDEICLEAVKKNGHALAYVKNQTEEICLEAVRQNGDAIKYINIDVLPKPIYELTVEEISKRLGYEIKIVK